MRVSLSGSEKRAIYSLIIREADLAVVHEFNM